MITGTVSGRHALVSLLISGPNGQISVEFVLDTGFAGFLALPPAIITALGLTYVSPQIARLANRSRIVLDTYRLTVLWDGEEREVEVLAMDGEPLLGMSMLDGSDLRLQVTDGGLVTIEAL
jgi:clan AA aspartic protease